MTIQSVLLDTGPFVALFDRRDAAHAASVQYFETCTAPLITTEAVLTETLHLLGTPRNQDLALEFVLRGAAIVVPADVASLTHCRALMRKYADVPMDYADATLVALADATGIADVFTLDRRGFSVYRIGGRRAFRVMP